MEAIYPFSALKTNQREVKNAALEGVVHVTENGRGAFVFKEEENAVFVYALVPMRSVR